MFSISISLLHSLKFFRLRARRKRIRTKCCPCVSRCTGYIIYKTNLRRAVTVTVGEAQAGMSCFARNICFALFSIALKNIGLLMLCAGIRQTEDRHLVADLTTPVIFVPRYGLCWIQKLECNRGVENNTSTPDTAVEKGCAVFTRMKKEDRSSEECWSWKGMHIGASHVSSDPCCLQISTSQSCQDPSLSSTVSCPCLPGQLSAETTSVGRATLGWFLSYHKHGFHNSEILLQYLLPPNPRRTVVTSVVTNSPAHSSVKSSSHQPTRPHFTHCTYHGQMATIFDSVFEPTILRHHPLLQFLKKPSNMSHHRARFIRLLQIQNFGFRQLDISSICNRNSGSISPSLCRTETNVTHQSGPRCS